MSAHPPLPDALLAKYKELLRKHESLVQRLEAHNAERISSWKLSNWGLEMMTCGLALLQEGALRLTNRRWNALAGEAGGWFRLGDGGSEPLLSLREVALHEARSLSDSPGDSSRVSSYQRSGSEQVLELRTESFRGIQQQPSVLVLALDITERMRTEQELTQTHQALAQREHLRSLGEMASGVVHDLTSTLNAMKLRLELIQRDTVFAERQRSHLDALVRIVIDANTRLKQLRDFSRQQPEGPAEPVQLADITQEVMGLVRSELEQRAEQAGHPLVLDVQVPPLPLVSGSASDLRYVLMNLLLNAYDAMPRGGAIHVRGALRDGQVVFTVEDEGTGIPEEHLRSIFRPFFTTKGSAGTGLGLSMAYGVVSRAGGTITAANRPGGGAVFTLTFPPLEAPAPVPEPRPARPTRARPARKRTSRRGR